MKKMVSKRENINDLKDYIKRLEQRVNILEIRNSALLIANEKISNSALDIMDKGLFISILKDHKRSERNFKK